MLLAFYLLCFACCFIPALVMTLDSGDQSKNQFNFTTQSFKKEAPNSIVSFERLKYFSKLRKGAK